MNTKLPTTEELTEMMKPKTEVILSVAGIANFLEVDVENDKTRTLSQEEKIEVEGKKYLVEAIATFTVTEIEDEDGKH